jgi:hypothetical protein
LCPSNDFSSSVMLCPPWHFFPERTGFITVEHLLGNKSISLYIVTKILHKISQNCILRNPVLDTHDATNWCLLEPCEHTW